MRLLVGITGCSGVIYGARLVEACEKLDIKTDLIISPTAKEIMNFETDVTPQKLQKIATRTHDYGNLGASIASGSVKTDGMVIAPCSMKTLGSIARGITDNLITRGADVTLKEGRKLILVPRETPLNQIHLNNMSKLRQAGGTIIPAAPGFYHDPQSIDDLVNFIVGKILDQLDINHELYKSWSGIEE